VTLRQDFQRPVNAEVVYAPNRRSRRRTRAAREDQMRDWLPRICERAARSTATDLLHVEEAMECFSQCAPLDEVGAGQEPSRHSRQSSVEASRELDRLEGVREVKPCAGRAAYQASNVRLTFTGNAARCF
jgi:hypothetical protein